MKKTLISKPVHWFWLVVAVVAAIGIGWLAYPRVLVLNKTNSDTQSSDHMSQLTVMLGEQNDSGESGTAALEEKSGYVTVTVQVSGSANAAQPAHIHLGTCDNLGSVKYPLTNVVDGVSSTTINTTLEELQASGPLSINIHESAEKVTNYVSCGELRF